MRQNGSAPVWGGAPGQFSLCGVECTPRWVGTSGLHGTESKTLGATLNLCTMIMRPYDLGEGDLVPK